MQDSVLGLNDFIDESVIFIKKMYASQQELFEDMYKVVLEKKMVREDFLRRVQAREAEFPTGIQLENMGVAIPHTDPECIHKEFVAISTLDQPIFFQRMDDKNQSTAVEIVFLLGLNQPHTQLNMLQTLMSLIQDQEKLATILNSKDKETMMLCINSFCKQIEE